MVIGKFPMAKYAINITRFVSGTIISIFETRPFKFVCVLAIKNHDWEHARQLSIQESISYPAMTWPEFLATENKSEC